ncbi:hypothetical protein ACERII_00825 [Evansella sp. AB-rgal1]|uniref:hypothetical protein n=1 Tax=Evansella sp. AB-rgal1 TaxID=3242696 RepID=UPI00359CFF27
MLKTKITYHENRLIPEFLKKLGFSTLNSEYKFPLSIRQGHSLVLQENQSLNEVVLSFPNYVSMEECSQIHNLIHEIVVHVNGKVDDTAALLGYDEYGQKVYIYHGFKQWKEYIEEAKFHSLEGQNVEVYHGDELLGRGLLLSYKKERVDEENTYITCTVISTTGEQYFMGENLRIVGVI